MGGVSGNAVRVWSSWAVTGNALRLDWDGDLKLFRSEKDKRLEVTVWQQTDRHVVLKRNYYGVWGNSMHLHRHSENIEVCYYGNILELMKWNCGGIIEKALLRVERGWKFLEECVDKLSSGEDEQDFTRAVQWVDLVLCVC